MKHMNTTATLRTMENVESHPASGFDAPATMGEVCRLMRRAADALEAAMAAIPAPLAPQPLPLAHPAVTTRLYAPTDWPRPLPRGEEPAAATLFDGAKFKECYQPGEAVEIYFGAGEGYKRISRTLCMPYYKIGLTALYGLKDRFRAHKAERYASFCYDGGRYVEDADFADQFPLIHPHGDADVAGEPRPRNT